MQQQLGIGEGGGAYAVWDDGNPAWETEAKEDEVAQEAMWRQDDAADGIGTKELSTIQEKVEQQAEATQKV